MFAGKHGFITLRDLFRWADRYRLEQQTEASRDWLQHLADDGEALSEVEVALRLTKGSGLKLGSPPFRLHAAGRPGEEAGGGGRHPVHPGQELQEDRQPRGALLSEAAHQPVQ